MIDPTGSSLDIQQDLRNQLKAILPQAFSDNNLDFEKLKQLLGDDFTSPREERYGISWAGKTDAFRELQQTTTNTLSPDSTPLINHDSTSPSVGSESDCRSNRTHEGIFIEGENLEVLKVLQKSYYGKVKMIYIDPPYNTGNDSFVYPDNFSETKAEYQEKGNINLNRLNLWQKNSKDSGKYHSSWLSMMYPRLFMARNLLREDGVIFISIDDNEQANLKLLMDEIFGEENFVANVIWQKKYSPQNDAKWFSAMHDYILIYGKNKELWRPFLLDRTEEQNARYSNPDNDPRGDWKPSDLSVKTYSKDYDYPITTPSGRIVNPPPSRCWRTSKENFQKLISDNRIWFGTTGENVPSLKRFLTEVKQGITPTTIWYREDVGDNQEAAKEIRELFAIPPFETPKPTRLIKRILHLLTNNKDTHIILDFFAGSGTTAQAVMELNAEDGGNRQFICIQMPEPTDEKSEAYKAGYQTIADITRARIQKVQEKLPFRAAAVAAGGVRPYGVGFYKLQPSNFKIWQSDIDTEEELLAQLELYAQPHTTPETPEENLLTELMLKAGFMLTANVQTINTADGIKLYDIENGTMTVALSALSEKVILTVCERKPKEFICLDNLFESDVQKSNWSLQLVEAGVNLQVI